MSRSLLRSCLPSMLAVCIAGTVSAQEVPSLRFSIPPPPTGAMESSPIASSLAIEGGYAVLGMPNQGVGAPASGVVKIFNPATGALLLTLHNPSPGPADEFGASVAISGTRLVVGASGDDTPMPNSGIAYVYDLAGTAPTQPILALHNPDNGGGIARFGASVAISGTRIVVGDPWTHGEEGRAHVFDLNSPTPALPVTSLRHPAPAADDYFGSSVGISGTRIVVGAYTDDNGAVDSGAAFVYDLNAAVPADPVITLDNPEQSIHANFGARVAISGSRVVVGAPWVGRVFYYDIDGTTPWHPAAILNNPSSPEAGDSFGASLAVSGARLVVSAPSAGVSAARTGVACIYDLSSGAPAVPTLTLPNPDPGLEDRFGKVVALSGSQVLAGVEADETGAGSVYVYDLERQAPAVPVGTLSKPGPAVTRYFGSAVAVSGKWMVAGVPLERTGTVEAGSAYVYDLTRGTPGAPVWRLANPEPAAGDSFGSAVAVSGNRLAVGAGRDSAAGDRAGSVYVYDTGGANPAVPVMVLHSPAPAANNAFGVSVAVLGSLVVVGEPGAGADRTGCVHLFDVSSDHPAVPVITLYNPVTDGSGTGFGLTVAASGSRVAVGMPSGTTDHAGGAVFVYDLNSVSPAVPEAVLINPRLSTYDYFGIGLAISGTRVAVGAPYNDQTAYNAGRVFVYDLASVFPTVPVASLNNPAPAQRRYFGTSVAIAGTRVVGGAYTTDRGGEVTAGSTYLFDLTADTLASPLATLKNPNPTAEDGFGLTAAMDEETIVIGAPYDDSVSLDRGFLHIYGLNPADLDGDGLLDAWETARFGTTAGHQALDDHDHDGYPELLELAFGLDPAAPDSAGFPSVTMEGGYLTMTITKQPGAAYEVQSGGTVQPGKGDSFGAGSTAILINDAATLKVRDSIPVSAQARRFMRVKVTAVP